jgi:enamine deaminase RidA (YjgF/YER057c/UK114 family)
MQCAATNYGSSFSRAVEVKLPVGRRLLVSGTASIEPGGKTVWMGDIQKQIKLSMEVVDSILKSRGMTFCDTVRASLYFKRSEYSAAFAEWCSHSGFKLLPGVPIHCDICRDDLLFEIELDTVAGD